MIFIQLKETGFQIFFFFFVKSTSNVDNIKRSQLYHFYNFYISKLQKRKKKRYFLAAQNPKIREILRKHSEKNSPIKLEMRNENSILEEEGVFTFLPRDMLVLIFSYLDDYTKITVTF